MAIIEKSPEQEVFDAIFATCLRLGYRTFDYLPADGTAYPFVYVGEIFQQDRHTKSGLFGDIQATVHIYNDRKKRRDTTTMRDTIKRELYKVKRAGNINLTLRRGTGQILIDNTTPEPLLHGVLELEFTFN